MAEKQVTLTDDGQEVQEQDYNLLGATAGLADDRILAEFLRLKPWDGTNVYKAVMPYSTSVGTSAATSLAPVVAPSGSANGSIQVNPFRAVVGSRNAANAAPLTNPTNDLTSVANWRDIRSAIFTGSSTTLSETVAIAANASGNPRWDLVYAQVSVDVAQNTVVRRVKDPVSAAISTPSVPQYNGNPVTVAVVAGTPGASPALPVLPADAAGNYCIPLAWVRVPNGFTSGSTVLASDIRSNVLAHDGTSPVSRYVPSHVGCNVEPANGNNDGAGTYATAFPWNPSAGGRPGPFLPPDWVGGKMLMVELDLLAGSSAGWSHTTGSVVDNSVDWRGRIFPLIMCQGTVTNDFANNNAGGATTNRVPLGTGNGNTIQCGNSIGVDGILVPSTSTVSEQTPSNNPAVQSGAIVGLYVDQTTGVLKAFISGTPGCRLFFFLIATAPMPNR